MNKTPPYPFALQGYQTPETLPLCVASRKPKLTGPTPPPCVYLSAVLQGRRRARWPDLRRYCRPRPQRCEDHKNPTGVQIKSNVDKVGDVTITAIQAGHKTLNDEDERSQNNAVRIAADIPLSDVNADLTGSVDYDLVSKNANVRIGYHKDDITVKLRTLIKQDGGDKRTAESTINLDYSGLEGIGVGVEVKDNKEGHLQVTKDDFKLKVPIKDNKVETNDASITYNWAIDM